MAYDIAQLLKAMKQAQTSAQGGGASPPQAAAAGAFGGGFVPPQKGGSPPPPPSEPGYLGPVIGGKGCPLRWKSIGGQWRWVEECEEQRKDCELEFRNLQNEIEYRYGRDAAQAYLPMLLQKLWRCQQENETRSRGSAPPPKQSAPFKPGPPVGQS